MCLQMLSLWLSFHPAYSFFHLLFSVAAGIRPGREDFFPQTTVSHLDICLNKCCPSFLRLWSLLVKSAFTSPLSEDWIKMVSVKGHHKGNSCCKNTVKCSTLESPHDAPQWRRKGTAEGASWFRLLCFACSKDGWSATTEDVNAVE